MKEESILRELREIANISPGELEAYMYIFEKNLDAIAEILEVFDERGCNIEEVINTIVKAMDEGKASYECKGAKITLKRVGSDISYVLEY